MFYVAFPKRSIRAPLSSKLRSRSLTFMSEQFLEPLDCKTCIFNDSTHGNRVHRIVSWNGDEMRAVAHYNVFTLAHHSEAGLFERLDRPEMINAGNFRHR